MRRLIDRGAIAQHRGKINDKGYAGAEDNVVPTTETSDGHQVDPSYKLVK